MPGEFCLIVYVVVIIVEIRFSFGLYHHTTQLIIIIAVIIKLQLPLLYTRRFEIGNEPLVL